ncbi:MAG TPA: polysaccharide biosynthesis/export family protein [Dongiaceae bacterium]|nr:polysaccharide biosynthesis/export family protein [Dongiaceae bacterium]
MGRSIAGARADRLVPIRLLSIALLATSLFAVACMHTPNPAPDVKYLDYKIGPPDRLTVTILPDPPVVESVVVRPDGMVTIQLVGDVPAGGRTTDQLAEDIQNRISRFKRGALVTVALASAESATITVLGEVRNPTTFSLVRQMRISDALGTVGGPTLFANEDSIQVVRAGGTPKVIPVDLEAIRDGDLRTNIQLYGGDIVYVPPTVLVKIGYAIQQVLFPFTPFFGVAAAASGWATH